MSEQVLKYTARNESKNNKAGIISVVSYKITDDTIFRSRKVKELYDWWLQSAPDIPHKSNFDIMDHLRNAPSIFLYKVRSRDEYEIRLNGEKANDILGKQYTGTIVNTLSAAKDAHLLNVLEYMQSIYDERRPMTCLGSYHDHLGRIHQFQSIDCPLVGDNGEIAQIVGVMEALSPNE